MKIFLGFVFAIMHISSLYAQCSFTVTASSTESRCRASGTITLTPSIPGEYSYKITAGPVTANATSSNLFEGLPAGTYTTTTTLNGCTVTKQVTVAGNYVEPSLQTGTVKNIACPGGTGCITAIQPTGGRLPYKYALVAPSPVTFAPQASPNFCGLPAGRYTLQSYDS